MNPLLLAEAIVAIPGSKSVSEFQSLSKIKSYTTTIELLNFLTRNGIGKMSDTSLSFLQIDKLNLLLLALQNGCEPKLLSSKLNWRDFEMFTTMILQQTKYFCRTNVHLTKPRVQIDIVASTSQSALIIDCKHWRDMAAHKRIECANQQQRRAKAYLKTNRDTKIGIPVIVTLNDHSERFVNRVPFVSIDKVRMFLTDFELYQDEISCVI